MSSRLLRSVRSGRRPAPSRPSLARRLRMVAAAVVVAGLATACGPSSTPAGSAAPPGAQEPASAPAADRTSQDASPAVSATASVLPPASASASASASVLASQPGAATGSASGSAGKGVGAAGSGSGSGSGSGTASGTGGAKPTSAALPAPAPAKVPGPGYDSSADAQALIDAALRSAKSDGRMVLLDFGANWCGNCKAADKVFAQPATSALLADDYHLVKVDIGGDSSANSALLRKYSPSGGTYTMPVLVVVSPSGTTRVDTHVSGNPSLTADGIGSFLRKWAP
ncbi:thiol:disulfide interchange protein precursor [Streptomyces lavendulae subsp. lavendulae]|uniref:Thiol:disulfide interchange protein n=1 Tax=Streptomyces lavendulae subsp. lavendulae TaxID=58340 RepID=A0A2K8P677_STRLA|nr:thioredoxin family protein [Streptomyces lavendulae]ATZ22249.1 thiol:disulfide interchange protein precursor [Streptomyces lavendulae subsp. lavendulae]